jgi:hypothetical protein
MLVIPDVPTQAIKGSEDGNIIQQQTERIEFGYIGTCTMSMLA